MGSNKKEYTKPELRIIELKAEEVLVAGCKDVGQFATGLTGPSCMVHHCSGKGS